MGIVNFDGLKNLFTGRGIQNDPQMGERAGSVYDMSDQEYLSLFRGTGLARAIVKRPVDRCTISGFSVKGDKSEEIQELMKRICFQDKARKLMYWDAVFGGGVIVIGAMGSGVLTEELREESVTDIEFLRVYRREEVDKTYMVNTDPESVRYGKPEYYLITSATSTYDVHWSRIIELDGEPVDDEIYFENNGWGDSIFCSTFDAIQRAENSLDSASRTMKDYSSYVVEIDGLFDAIAEGKQSKILDRLRLFQQTRDSMNVIIHDKDEAITKVTTSLAGIENVIDKQLSGLTSTSGIPARILLGSQGGGLNNKGEGESGDWRDYLEDLRQRKYVPILDRVFELACYSVGADLDTHSYELGEIDKPTQKERAEVYAKMAEGDSRYSDISVLSREEIRETRFTEDGALSFLTKVSEDYDDIALSEDAVEIGGK